MRKLFLGSAMTLVAILVIAAVVIGTGLYDVAADEEHTGLVYSLIQTARERSIAARTGSVDVPTDLADDERARRGAGNYDSMCVGCHLKPAADETEMSRGLYPRPPNLVNAETSDPARAFWIIKHGIKSTGMPAWGKSMEDSHIWDMVAFIRTLPALTAEQYAAAVEASEGHSHGGGESTNEQGEHGEEHEH